jgi:hypothetical protein
LQPLVAQVGGPQEGIHDGVDQNIAVAVAHQAAVVGDFNAAQHQPSARPQRVSVKANAYAKVHEYLR